MATTRRPERFLTTREAADLLGVSAHALGRRVRAGHLTAHLDPSDLRVRLIDAHELQRYMKPRPIARNREEVPMANTA